MASAFALVFVFLVWLFRRPRRIVYQGTYADYLQTPHWRRCREMALARDGHRCRRCGSPYALQVHHLSYAYPWHEHEHLEVLETLCRRCHASHHARCA